MQLSEMQRKIKITQHKDVSISTVHRCLKRKFITKAIVSDIRRLLHQDALVYFMTNRHSNSVPLVGMAKRNQKSTHH